ncbi:MAG: hypothetical protein IPH05_01320 [Flavobacteriales bacterium]|jgi:hypothetical protein|nr:hypothetical protein [Flavobacteriales bacterium]MBK6550250.1 hypothetical protein [Flavobacteriales bacterium]MBK6881586.1 hypothetical protein [Flavobacteriales bacterium]MBK7102902.1 hypothetical protein [Flavobacteriales bacterium]MBK7113493.1 hypothetical protein [Flavobacteriales bacterium]
MLKGAFCGCFLFGTLTCLTQPTLDTGVLPETGSIYGYHDIPFLKAGPAGAGVRWDFSSLPTGTLVPYTWSTTDIAPGAGAFPSNSLVRQVPGEPTAYFHGSDTALLWMGTYTDTALIRFDPPLLELPIPMHAGDRWTDSAIVAVTGAGRMSILDVRLDAKADAWGTLVMPYGVVSDAVRVRSDLVLLDRRYKAYPVRTVVRYTWYSPRTPMPLLEITERSGWAPPDRITRWLDGSWQEDPATLFKPIALRPFPDPCVDIITLDLPAARADRTILQLVDASGNVAMQWHEEFNSPQTRRLTLDIASAPAGLYTLTWIGTNGTLGTARLTKR